MNETRVELGSSFDPRMIPDNAWTFRRYSDDGQYRIWTYTDTSLDITIEKKEPLYANDILKLNQEKMKASDGTRWGDGRVVASVPLNVFFKEFAGRHEDPEYTDWWLNNPDNLLYRTRKGHI
jgi:hypothetical protein